MKLREFYVLNNDVYKVAIYSEDWSQRDKQLMGMYGEPEVQVGGVFTGIGGLFTLPTELLHVMSETPFIQEFDARDYTYAENMADVWADTISARIEVVVATLRANDDAYTREEVTNV